MLKINTCFRSSLFFIVNVNVTVTVVTVIVSCKWCFIIFRIYPLIFWYTTVYCIGLQPTALEQMTALLWELLKIDTIDSVLLCAQDEVNVLLVEILVLTLCHVGTWHTPDEGGRICADFPACFHLPRALPPRVADGLPSPSWYSQRPLGSRAADLRAVTSGFISGSLFEDRWESLIWRSQEDNVAV